jgi:hypothetical protein
MALASKKRMTASLGLGGACWALVACQACASDQDWSCDLTPYLWVPTVTLQSTVPSTPDAGSEVDRFATHIAAGAMMAAAVQYRSVGTLVDFAWARLDTESVNPSKLYSSIALRSDFYYSTAALTYQIPTTGRFQAHVLAGARFWYIDEDFTATRRLQPTVSADEHWTWVDPMVSGTMSYAISRRWSAQAVGMIGGFHVSATLAADVFTGIRNDFASWCSATLGYRYVYERYDANDFTYRLQAYAALLGVGFHL